MRWYAIMRILGILLMVFSLSMLSPLPFSFYYHDTEILPFLAGFGMTLGAGFALWWFNRRAKHELSPRDGFVVVFAMWVVLSLFGALPFLFGLRPNLSLAKAIFETISGLSTTGATTLSHLDRLPKSVLYYREQLQFLGGMGIVVLAVAIMPLIGVGGMQLYKAEMTGPLKDDKITPKIMQTAKALWLIYVGLTVICALCYWAFGMSKFDALCYAFATLSTGGAAPHDANIAYYPHIGVYVTAIVFMILGGTNFSLHFVALRQRSLKSYWQNSEFRAYLSIMLVISLIMALVLFAKGVYHHPGTALLQAAFHAVAFTTTTAFIADWHYAIWPLFLPLLLMFISMQGGCAGSTSGGVKVLRVLLLRLQLKREVNILIHPQGVFPIKLDNRVVPERMLNSIWAFFAGYVMIFILLWMALLGLGLEPVTAFSALACCLSNAGSGLAEVATNFGGLTDASRWVLSLAMLTGRLEVFTVLVLFSRSFWKV